MKKLFLWLGRKINRAQEEAEESMYINQATISSPRIRHHDGIDAHGFNLKVYKARGGTVIETSLYDRKRDESHTALYVITDDKDMGEEIGKIITMENLKA